MMLRALALVLGLSATVLAGCDQLGLNDAKSTEAEGKAIGAACRQSGRALEDCYQLNPAVPKAAVFAGWKDMNDYMTEQKLEVVKPMLPPTLPKGLKGRTKGEDTEDARAGGETKSDKAAADATGQSGDATASAPTSEEAGGRKAKSGKEK